MRALSARELHFDGALVIVLACGLGPAADAASPITIDNLPTVSSPTVVADDTTPYMVTMTTSDGDGYEDIKSVRVLFNVTESGGDPNNGRGYLSWGQTDADINYGGGTWVHADAAGGGRWAYRTDAWGGTDYLTPVGCQTTTGGSGTGGTGSRTVTWTFTAKPAWAANPLVNDADGWVSDSTSGLGWQDNPEAFDVVASPCGSYADVPNAPIASSSTATTLDIAINPVDSDVDLFAVRVLPPGNDSLFTLANNEYIQGDGTVRGFPAWQAKAQWATTTVTGLNSNTAYTFTVRAWNGIPGTCPSAWGEGAAGGTEMLVRAIDAATDGITIHKGVHGMSDLPWAFSAQRLADNLAVSVNTGIRFGGDGYDWKTRTAEWGSGTGTTLDYLRYARDRNSYLQILTNTRGVGTGNGATWVYTDQTPQTLAALAADWVYYCNTLVQTKRQGDALTSREQSIIESMDWGDDDKLLAPGEAMVPRVNYWEIGNEPEGPYPPPPLTPEDYANRYNIISTSVIAEDPTIKVGPCIMTADNGNAWLDAVFSDEDNRVDFVAYHPYGNLYYITRDNSGGVLNGTDLMNGLNVQKQIQNDRRQKIIDRLVANGRPADTELIISEWNPSSWQGTYYYNLSKTVAQGLGIAENAFTFAEMGIVASQYWESPNHPSTSAIETPAFKVYGALQADMGDTLIDSLVDGYFRFYATRDSSSDKLVLWAVNLSETDQKTIGIRVEALPREVVSITHRELAAYDGETSLVMSNSLPEAIGWTETDWTGQINLADFAMTIENATLAMLIIDLVPTVVQDFDRDGDVDQDDFGHFQACLTGPAVPQTDPDCQSANLDGDSDVDQDDFGIFQGCLSGPANPADPNCAG